MIASHERFRAILVQTKGGPRIEHCDSFAPNQRDWLVAPAGIPSLVSAVPVIDREVALRLQNHCDWVVALAVVDDLIAVGRWYRHFDQLTDGEVLHCLGSSAGRSGRMQSSYRGQSIRLNF